MSPPATANSVLADEQRRLRQRDALMALTRSELLAGNDPVTALRHIVQTAAEALQVARVSVWRYHAEPATITCLTASLPTGTPSITGVSLQAREYPKYFAHLITDDIVAAHEAETDPRTEEFTKDYLQPARITSMLDAPVRFGGRLEGVLCHEHVGPARHWHADEESFAVALANVVALVLERQQRQRVQERLMRSEATLANAQRIAHVGSWELDVPADGNWENNPPVRWSDEVYRILGLAPGSCEATLENCFSHIPPEERPRVRQEMAAAIREGRSFCFEHPIIRADGTRRIILRRGDCVADPSSGQILRLEGIFLDVTERKEAEATLAQREVDFRQLFAESPLPMWVFEASTYRFLAVNEAAIRHYGYSREEFLAMTIEQIRPADDVNRLREAARSEATLYAAGIWRHRRKDGSLIDVEITARALMFQGRLAKLILAHDVTARVTAEGALRESELRFRQLAESLPEMFWLKDAASGQVLYASPAYRTIWQRAPENLYRDPFDWLAVVHEDDLERVRAAVQTKQRQGTYHVEFRIRRADGEIRWIQAKASPVRDAEGRLDRIAGFSSDITERRALERQLLHAQRVESIGTLASGVAHDLNNILTPIVMSVGLVRSSLEGEKNRRMLDLIDRSAQRGAGIVSQLLTFSRSSVGERVPLDLRHILREIASLVTETFPRNIAVTYECARDLRLLAADPTQLHQVLLNLCLNARDAMVAGGELRLSAENVQLPDARLSSRVPMPAEGPQVLITVADTGEGIAPAIIDRIFDPFFTTKEPGKGTGLGLSTALGIVRAHGGHLWVDSVPRKGTTFQVLLPALTLPVEAPTIVDTAPARGHEELILVVDDELPIRQALRRLLKAQGYRVVEAEDGEHALRQFIAHRSAIKLVLTDLMMPRLNGAELGAALRRLEAGIPIVLFTGLRGENTASLIGNVDRIVDKPCAPSLLFGVVAELLHPRPAVEMSARSYERDR